jgi:hypothetical protein
MKLALVRSVPITGLDEKNASNILPLNRLGYPR